MKYLGLKKNSFGFTLIELMIAMLLGLLVLSTTIAIYVIAIRGSSDAMKSAQLNQDVGVVMTIMNNDIRRAGYWGGAKVGEDITKNPFNDIEVHSFGGVADSCITYTYDANGDELMNDDEFYGFRLNNDTVEMKQSGSSVTDCNDGVWVDMIDTNTVTVNSLTFELDEYCAGTNSPCVLTSGQKGTEIRRVSIDITAEASGDGAITTESNNSTQIRNNKVYIEP